MLLSDRIQLLKDATVRLEAAFEKELPLLPKGKKHLVSIIVGAATDRVNSATKMLQFDEVKK